MSESDSMEGKVMLIGNKYKIESDSLNYTLYKPVTVKKTGGIRWQPVAYFSNMVNALDFLVDLKVAETGLKELRTVIKKQEEIYQLIRSLKLG